MDIEEKIERLNAKLERFSRPDKQFRIGTQMYEFSDKSPIFLLNGPNRKQTRTGTCYACRFEVFEDNSKIKFCHFCGMNVCENCCYKERMFPRGRINADGQKPRGEICKVCDRMFMIRAITLETAVTINKSVQNVKNLDN